MYRNTNSAVIALAASCLLSLGGCATSSGGLADNGAVKVMESLPAPTSDQAVIDYSDFALGPFDEIEVTVLNSPDLSRKGAIDGSGDFQMPLIGSLRAVDLKPAQLSQRIADALNGRFVRNPQVTVSVTKPRERQITVDGAVREPGLYPVIGSTTLQQAIARAKGASDIASISRVVVFRMVGGQKMAAQFNLKDIRRGAIADPVIYGNDVIVVGENAARRALRDASSFNIFARFVPVP